MFLSLADQYRRRDQVNRDEIQGVRRKLLMAGLIAMHAPFCHAIERHKANNMEACSAGEKRIGAFGKTPHFPAKTRGGKKYIVCRECLIKRAAQRSAFVSKEA